MQGRGAAGDGILRRRLFPHTARIAGGQRVRQAGIGFHRMQAWQPRDRAAPQQRLPAQADAPQQIAPGRGHDDVGGQVVALGSEFGGDRLVALHAVRVGADRRVEIVGAGERALVAA
ncbi:hypothetical protein A8B95_13515 [Bordetella pertussis]|nr:hypothetical protein A8B95_13515 [Bordetella pertussis]